MGALLNRILRRPSNDLESPMSTEGTVAGEKPTTDIVMRFLTVGAATVELRTHRFRTRYTGQGRPYVGDHAYEVEGFTWACRGCDATSSTSGRVYIRLDYGRYLPTERDDARQDANAHAEACRAMPKPTA